MSQRVTAGGGAVSGGADVAAVISGVWSGVVAGGPALSKMDDIRPRVCATPTENHRGRCGAGPFAISPGLGILSAPNVVTTPAVVIRPIVLFPRFVNQRAPSQPPVIRSGLSMPSPRNVVMTPSVVTRSIEFDHRLVAQSAPSEPTVSPVGIPSASL
jgi:hypothetical protein